MHISLARVGQSRLICVHKRERGSEGSNNSQVDFSFFRGDLDGKGHGFIGKCGNKMWIYCRLRCTAVFSASKRR